MTDSEISDHFGTSLTEFSAWMLERGVYVVQPGHFLTDDAQDRYFPQIVDGLVVGGTFR